MLLLDLKLSRFFLAFVLLCLLPFRASAQPTWSFDPAADDFADGSLLDLTYLNEDVAGQSGWVAANAEGDFVLGDGSPVRFWAVNSDVERRGPSTGGSSPGWQTPQYVDRHAAWLAKRGVNLVRLHAHINPSASQEITDVNQDELDWIWRTVGAMREEGVYTVLSPYWANTMKSNDGNWGTDWNGKHHGLLFFDETLQAAYKEWLRVLFTTPTDYLDGGTLADEPSLAIFQLQNEDSLLFWTTDRLADGPKQRLGKLFFEWAVEKYGSIGAAFDVWGTRFSDDDDLDNDRLGLGILWNLTGDGKNALGAAPRMDDQLQFYVETMMAFNTEMRRFIREDLDCPVLVNAGNWKSADVVYLEDSERYSYANSTDVVALNRYFSGVHEGPRRGWAITAGDQFTNPSVLKDSVRSLPISVKQPAGKPTMVTESTWVMPMETAFEAPMLISAYSSLSGFDAYFWFAADTEGFVPPRSANGFLPSQQKWLAMTPDMAGQWPAAALAFRKGYIQQGQPVVQEHRSLDGMWQRKSPLIAESASFDPNRDSGDLPPDSSFDEGVDPLAFLVGPVTVTYDSSESNSAVNEDLDTFISSSEEGDQVSSVTGELHLDTALHRFTVDAPNVQSLITYEPALVELGDVSFSSQAGGVSITAISLDEQPLSSSSKVLVQMATRSRPSGWAEAPAEIELSSGTVSGLEVTSYGSAPWELDTVDVAVSLRNARIDSARALDANGMPTATLDLTVDAGEVSFGFPEGALYVLLEGPPVPNFSDWADSIPWTAPLADALPTSNPDGDKADNLLEFARDTDPLAPDDLSGDRFEWSRETGERSLTVDYRRALQTRDLSDAFEYSEDLKVWESLETAPLTFADAVTHADPDQDGTAEERRLVLQFGGDVDQAFVRRTVTDLSAPD